MTYDEAMELPLDERNWMLERIGAQRAKEAKAIENAGKKKGH